MANIRHALALRARAVHVITTVFAGRALDTALDQDRERHGRHGLVEELAIGTIRQTLGLGAIVSPLLKRPFKKADQDIYALVLMGLYQARNMDSPEAVAVSEAVATTEALGKPWARGVVNAVLRAALAHKAPSAFAPSNHPPWFVARMQKAWPDDWLSIIEANDRRAPLALRVDTQQISRDDYLKRLAQIGIQAVAHPVVPSAITLSGATPILELPGFREGLVSVQDAAAQCAAWLVAPKTGDTVLDACAAPGGKTGHLAQACPDARITAVDRDPARVVQLCDTLTRLQRISDIQILTLDLTTTEVPGSFRRILLDAPCSATGV
ncbi:MAG: transcription antitermination factor NusB, partial [Acidiferrobacter sp.]